LKVSVYLVLQRANIRWLGKYLAYCRSNLCVIVAISSTLSSWCSRSNGDIL